MCRTHGHLTIAIEPSKAKLHNLESKSQVDAEDRRESDHPVRHLTC